MGLSPDNPEQRLQMLGLITEHTEELKVQTEMNDEKNRLRDSSCLLMEAATVIKAVAA